MGMYTAFRGKVIIKEQYKELVELINSGEWGIAVNKYPFLKEFYEIQRSTIIPYDIERIRKQLDKDGEIYLEHDPSDWASDSTYFTGLNGLEWTFITSLKDYPDREHGNKSPIVTFIDVVLSEVTSKVITIQEAYEEWIYNDIPFVEYDFDKVVINKITIKI
ncbi:hypothetical protein [Lysinibacillus sphaericus]|uniref:hypothetical protein n=1 Tax=Lysinibacillus TaxID=400634 RepID=UPI0007771877|nr:hypothetical protein [Lysinibacillus sphaericus]MBE5086167.1 hypothetical protein [Bacillus thuringiensis]AMO35329.1 hypothetical protein AR327_22830 [Lysinibacillus sphaericus]AMR93068.1 hypothetical protein A1T07_22955 [Lysinibacillus sphaericus]MBG9710738.1 hypothetical protein [Lysinibacillus sphaericus]MBG9730345.1 hypothetical protein [Lysinibacillus sphaericus]